MKTVAWAMGAAALVSAAILALPTHNPARADRPVADREIARTASDAADKKALVAVVVSGKDGRADKIRIGF